MEKKLQRDENGKMVAGVAAGLAEYFEVDVTWVRIGFILAVLAGLSGILAYIVLWIAVPVKPFNPYNTFTPDYRVYNEKPFSEPRKEYQNPTYNQPLRTNRQDNNRLIAGAILIFIGLYFLSDQFYFLPYWFSFHKLWPLALIIPGILILTKAGKKQPWEHAAPGPDGDKKENPAEPVNPDQSNPQNDKI